MYPALASAVEWRAAFTLPLQVARSRVEDTWSSVSSCWVLSMTAVVATSRHVAHLQYSLPFWLPAKLQFLNVESRLEKPVLDLISFPSSWPVHMNAGRQGSRLRQHVTPGGRGGTWRSTGSVSGVIIKMLDLHPLVEF